MWIINKIMIANGLLPAQLGRLLFIWTAALLIFARTILPMGLIMPAGLSSVTICGAHGIETIQLDQNMNRVNPGDQEDAQHCGLCTLIFGFIWAIALFLCLAAFTAYAPHWRKTGWILLPDFHNSSPRSPPVFS